MLRSDFERFRAVMAGMSELYQRELSSQLLDVYWLAFGDWSLQEFEDAAAHLMGTNQFMPRPSDFTVLRISGRPTAGEAWVTALENSRSAIVCGQVTSGTSCGDPLVDRCARAVGGYGVIAMCDTDKLCFLERRFAEHYESIQDAEDVREAVPQLTFSNRQKLTGPTSMQNLLGRFGEGE